MLDTARSKRIDVLFLQEVHSDQCNEGEWEGQVALSHNTTLSGGVGIFFSRRFTPSSLEVEQEVEGRCLLVKAKFDTFTLVFINIYAPNNAAERKSFLEVVNSKLNCCGSEDYLIFGGDFNCAEAEFLDRNHAEPHPASQHTLKQLVSECFKLGFKEVLSYFWCVFRDRKNEFDSLRQWWDHGKV